MGKRSAEIEVLEISRDGEGKKTDELIHEEELTVKLYEGIHKFYCMPVDLKEMIVGNLKSRYIDTSLSQIKKLGSIEFEVNVSEESVRIPRKCDSKKEISKSEVFDSVEALYENSFLYQETDCTHVIGVCGDKEIFVEDIK